MQEENMNTTIQTLNGHIYHINEDNLLTTKPHENLIITVTITEKEAQQLRHASITIRELLEKISMVYIGNKDTKEVRYTNIEDISHHLPEIDDWHYPLP
jgi:hypothetical protein